MSVRHPLSRHVLVATGGTTRLPVRVTGFGAGAGSPVFTLGGVEFVGADDGADVTTAVAHHVDPSFCSNNWVPADTPVRPDTARTVMATPRTYTGTAPL